MQTICNTCIKSKREGDSIRILIQNVESCKTKFKTHHQFKSFEKCVHSSIYLECAASLYELCTFVLIDMVSTFEKKVLQLEFKLQK